MANLQTMYPGVANSPDTFLKEDLAKDATVMYLSDGSVLGALPTLAVIGGGADAETVLVTSTRSDGGYTIERGVEGEQKAWKKADLVARNWTNKDYEAIRTNIEAVNESLENESVKRKIDLQKNEQKIAYEMDNLYSDVDTKVDKVDGKGLSTNDYTNNDKAKVQEIPTNPKYTDTIPDLTPYAKKTEIPDLTPYAKKAEIPDLTPYAKKTDIKTRLADMTSDSTHRTVTDTEKKTWNGKVDAVSGKVLSTNDYTTAEKEKVARMKESVILTQAEYDALPASDKDDAGKIYFIKA